MEPPELKTQGEILIERAPLDGENERVDAAAREPQGEILVERAPLEGENERVGAVERAPLGEVAERAPLHEVEEHAPLGEVEEHAPLGEVAEREPLGEFLIERPTPLEGEEQRVDAPEHKALGEILIARGKLDQEGLERALRLQQDGGEKLGVLLVTLGVCAQRDVAEALATQLGLPLLDAKGYPEFPMLEERISARFLREAHALPVREDEHELALAMADPTDEYAIGAFRMVTGRDIKPVVAIPTEFEAAFERLYGTGKTALGQIVGDIESRATTSRSMTTSST